MEGPEASAMDSFVHQVSMHCSETHRRVVVYVCVILCRQNVCTYSAFCEGEPLVLLKKCVSVHVCLERRR